MIGDVSAGGKTFSRSDKGMFADRLDAIKPWAMLAILVQQSWNMHIKNGYTVVRDFAGHGVGNGFHEDPIVPHIGMRAQAWY